MKPTEEKIHADPSDLPIYLFKQGNNCEAYRYFGAHIETRAGESGVVFRVWAPHATAISVVGDFNSWKPGSHPMRKVDNDSVWELFIPGMKEYDVYKYCVTTRAGDLVYKADPYAFHAETRPSNGSKVYDLSGFAGGAQTKVLHFVENVRVVKDNLFPVPPLFKTIQEQSGTDWAEMYKVFNMGHRLEVYLSPEHAEEVIAISESFGIPAQIVGRIEACDQTELIIKSEFGEFRY